MAVRNDNISINVSVETRKAQQQIHELEKATRGLKDENKSIRKEMNQLIATGRRGSEEYSRLERQYKANTAAIRKNSEEVSRLEGTIDASAKSYNQLRKQAKDLQSQLNNTVRALEPEKYAQLERQLQQVNEAMGKTSRGARTLKDSISNVFKGAFAQIGYNITNALGGAIARMKDFAAQSIDMAARADGVRHAFRALDDGRILDNLRKATKGTVDDLQLMTAAVKARDFRIPLEDMGKFLAFAQLKAQQTGQSVDYMTESIVTGLGRKSLLILDNLGLSAAEIREETARTGDFMKGVSSIVERQLQTAGTYVSAQDKAAQTTVALRNAQIRLGEALAWVGDLQLAATRTMARMAEGFASMFNERSAAAVKALGIALGNVAAAFGLWKASMLASAGAHRLHIMLMRQAVLEKAKAAAAAVTLSNAQAVAAARTTLLTSATKRLTSSLKASAIAMLKNPYAIAAAAVAGMTFAIYRAITAETAHEAAMRRSAETIGQVRQQTDRLKQSAQSAAATMTDASASVTARLEAYRKLRKIMPGVLDDLTAENALLLDNADLQERIARKAMIAQATSLIMKKNRLERDIAALQQRLEEEKQAKPAMPGQIVGQNVTTLSNQIASMREEAASYQKEADEIVRTLREGSRAIARQQEANYGEQYEAARTAWLKAKQELDRISADRRAYTLQQYEDAVALEAKARQAWQKLGGGTGTKTAHNTPKQEPEAADTEAATAQEKEPFWKKMQDNLNRELEAWRRYVKEYGTLHERRAAITMEYNAKIAAATTGGDRKMLQRQMQEALSELDLEELKGEINWELVFGDLSKASRKSLTEVRQQLKEFRQSTEYKTMGVEQKKVVDEALSNIQSAIIDSGGLLGDLPEQLSELQKAQEELDKAQRQYNEALKNGTKAEQDAARDKKNKAERDSQNAETNVTKSRDKAVGNMEKLTGSIIRLGTASELSLAEVGKLSVSIIDSFAEVGEQIGGIVGAVLSLLDAIGEIGLDKLVGNVLEGLAHAAQKGWNATFSLFGIKGAGNIFGGADYSDFEEAMGKYESLSEVWDVLLDKKREYISMSYGPELLQVGKEAEDIIRKDAQAQRDLARLKLNSGASAGSHSIGVRIRDEFNRQDWADIAGALGMSERDAKDMLGGRLTGLLDLTAEQLSDIRDNAPEAWAKMGYGISDFLDKIIESEEKLEELREQIKEQATAISFDTMADNFTSSLMDMEKNAKDFTSDFSRMLMKSVLQARLAELMENELRPFYDRWAEYAQSGEGLSQGEIDALKSDWDSIVQKGISIRDQVAAVTGYDRTEAGGASQQGGSSGGFAAMGQDTADELNGRFTALQAAAEDIRSMMQVQNVYMSEITDISIESNEHLAAISANTRAIAAISKTIERIEMKVKTL